MDRLNELDVFTTENNGVERISVTGDEYPYMDAWWPEGHVIGWEHTFVHENYEFLSAIDEERSYEPNFDQGLSNQRVVDAIQRSHRNGSWISV